MALSTSALRSHQDHRPPPEAARWRWLAPPVNDLSGGSAGYLDVNGQVYHVREVVFVHDDESAGRLWKLRKPGQDEPYQVCLNPATGNLECDCPDATYRGRTCKHVFAIVAAFRAIDQAKAQTRPAPQSLPAWRKVLRDGFLPGLTDAQLTTLRAALRDDDRRIVQGTTTQPPPMQAVLDWPCEGACAVSFCGWQDGRPTVGEVEEFFARLCYDADNRLGEPAACRFFLNWYDDTPREVMRRQLLAEVTRELARRQDAEPMPF